MTSSQHTPQPARLRREPKERAFALQIVAAQMIFTGVLAVLGWLFGPSETSIRVAIAILCGGMISSLANLWLAIIAFRPALGKPPGQMLAAFYLGELSKYIITVMLFLLLFKKTALFKQQTYALLLFTAYVMVQCTTWAYPLARSKFIARQRRS